MTRTHVEDIDALPTPDFAGLDFKDYLAPYPVLPILTGKGCYFNRCKFCDIPYINHISRKAYRLRDVDKIATDINTLADRFGCRHFLINHQTVIDRPGNSFDMHRFGLELRTDYLRDCAGFQIEILPAALAKDFVIGVDRTQWRNPSGLNNAAYATLGQLLGRCVSEAGARTRDQYVVRFH